MSGLFQDDPQTEAPPPPEGPGLFGDTPEPAHAVAYRVLARKYRPTRFDDLIGQNAMVRILRNAFATGRIAHAFMLTGVRGVGKTTTARIIARALNCTAGSGPTADPCGVCADCVAILADRHPDVVEMDAASRTGVDDVREIIEATRYRPVQARTKVFIIDEVHMLSRNAFNALLKTLEEPPPHVKFVFATTEVHKIPGTILSRCQRFDFKLISTPRLAAHLTEILKAEKIDATPEAVRLVARQAAGSVRDGLSLLDQTIAYVGSEKLTAEVTADVLGIADRQLLVGLATAALDRDPGNALRLIARAADRGVDLGQLGRSFLGFLRDLEIIVSVKPAPGVELGDLIDATPEEIDEAKGLAERGAPGLFTVLFDRWARAVEEASQLPTPRPRLSGMRSIKPSIQVPSFGHPRTMSAMPISRWSVQIPKNSLASEVTPSGSAFQQRAASPGPGG